MSLIDRIKSRLQSGKGAAGADTTQVSRAVETEMANLSGYESRYTEVSALNPATAAEELDYMELPFIGRHPVTTLRNVATVVMAVSAVAFIALSALTITRSNNGSAQIAATGEALMQSQRLAKSVSQAMVGDAQGIKDVDDSYKTLDSRVRALEKGDSEVPALGSEYLGDVKAIDASV